MWLKLSSTCQPKELDFRGYCKRGGCKLILIQTLYLGMDTEGWTKFEDRTFKFAITEKYIDEIPCEVVPLDACQVIMGSPYSWGRDAIFYRPKQKYWLVKEGKGFDIKAGTASISSKLVAAAQANRLAIASKISLITICSGESFRMFDDKKNETHVRERLKKTTSRRNRKSKKSNEPRVQQETKVQHEDKLEASMKGGTHDPRGSKLFKLGK